MLVIVLQGHREPEEILGSRGEGFTDPVTHLHLAFFPVVCAGTSEEGRGAGGSLGESFVECDPRVPENQHDEQHRAVKPQDLRA